LSIYKACDIRGDAAEELSAELYQRWGRALGQMVPPGAMFLAGGDVRQSTPPFLRALVDGLEQAGAAAVDLGLLPTPMIYFARRHFDAAACAIVTASHNPHTINGLKWTIGQRPPEPADVHRLAAAAGETEASGLSAANGPGARGRGAVGRPIPTENVRQLEAAYRDWLVARWAPHGGRMRQTIVVDPMWGCWADRAVALLRQAFPNARFEAVHDRPRGDFGGVGPDPSRSERLVELGEAVRRHQAALGMALDGDGDRVAWVDEEGVALSPEQATWVLLQSFGEALAGERFVYDLKFSDRLAEAAAALGAEPLAERSGHAFIRRRMLESGARFGAEVSGHYFYGDLGGGDDGLDTACRMLAFLGRTQRGLGQWRRECPAIVMTPDLRVRLEPEAQAAVLADVRARFADRPQSTIDGVRVDFDDGWMLVRSSVTEPALTFRFEAQGAGQLGALVERICNALGDPGAQLRRAYRRRCDAGNGA
jgi:phosphomannomutase/phosphoglucomutase